MNGFKKFKVIPDVPEKLKALNDIAYNVWLTWTPDAIKLFVRMDEELWNLTQHNPVKMLGAVSQERLNELANDEGYVVEVEWVQKKLQAYLAEIKKVCAGRECRIAYFSLEYGLTEALPIYSGGLGVLAGDHIKSSSDIGLNLTGIGLLYQSGYFQQYLNQDGWQQDFYKPNDFFNMQVAEVKEKDGGDMEIGVDLPGRTLWLKVWKLAVGAVTIYFMDSNIEKNSDYDRKLTAQLYGGGREMRLEQEIILGIGGVRLLEKLRLDIHVFHMNEGHSSFAVFERTRMLMSTHNLSFVEAMEITRKSGVFTTHTPVPAGNDEFHPDLIRKYFKDYCGQLHQSIEDFLGFGRLHPDDHTENFSMSVLAIRHSGYINGVSQLHAIVSRNMWKELWPNIPEEHIPIKGITNGIHVATWLSFEMSQLLLRYLGDKWQEKQDSREVWEKVNNIPDPELWRVRSLRRRRLVYFLRERLKKQLISKGSSAQAIAEANEALDPEALTIGFARRFATYKRGNLIFRDMERLLNILNNTDRPVQFIFAGKAHPQDHAGKEIIKNVVHLIKDYNLIKKVVFIEDYDMNVARYMVQGVDLWLNNPLRPHEASGTSGMKASANGVLNLSVLDGWWDEAYDHTNGWAIGNGESYSDRQYQDEVESKAVYAILENDIVPMFYQRGKDRLPRQWIKMIKNNFASIVSYFNTHRMIKNYFETFYQKAGENFIALSRDDFKRTKELVTWKERVGKDFYNTKIERIDFDDNKAHKIGDKIKIDAVVYLGKLSPEDVSVDIYYGDMAADDSLSSSAIEKLETVTPVKGGEGKYTFSGNLTCARTGNFGFKVRVTPYHPLASGPYEMNMVIWQ
ncbi:MAG: glycosyltransferase family 1 protein [bacterium]|nr:glycosyltransferase family 1 protein [bacterium]